MIPGMIFIILGFISTLMIVLRVLPTTTVSGSSTSSGIAEPYAR